MLREEQKSRYQEAERLNTRLRGQLARKVVGRTGLYEYERHLALAKLADDTMKQIGPAKNVFGSNDLSNPKYVLDTVLRNFPQDFQR